MNVSPADTLATSSKPTEPPAAPPAVMARTGERATSTRPTQLACVLTEPEGADGRFLLLLNGVVIDVAGSRQEANTKHDDLADTLDSAQTHWLEVVADTPALSESRHRAPQPTHDNVTTPSRNAGKTTPDTAATEATTEPAPPAATRPRMRSNLTRQPQKR